MDRRSLIAAGLGLGLGPGMGLGPGAPVAAQAPLPGPATAPEDPREFIDLWPKGALPTTARPLAETVTERSTDSQIADRAIFGISRPRMAVFRPEKPNGAAVLLMPGGGYRWVVIDKEGYEMARWLAARGFTAFVLFYRLPGEGWPSGPDTPLADAQRAMRLIRARAADYAIDPDRIAAMGFSAGGHVCASLSTRFAVRLAPPLDAADRLPARPICAALIYPVVSMDPEIAHSGSRSLLLGPGSDPDRDAAYSPDHHVPPDAPPHFLLHAADDASVPVANTLRLHAALSASRVPVELHIFASGGHGFGLRKAIGMPVQTWPDLWRHWARTAGLG